MRAFLAVFGFFLVIHAPVLAFSTDLEAAWAGVCHEKGEQGYLKDTLTFRGNRFELAGIHYKDSGCQNGQVRIESQGTVSFARHEATANFSNLNFTSEATYMTPLSGAIAFGMNLISVCGTKGWAANVKKNVSGKTCEGEKIPAKGETVYNIYSIEKQTTLYLGLETEAENGETPETRPTSLETNEPFTKLRK